MGLLMLGNQLVFVFSFNPLPPTSPALEALFLRVTWLPQPYFLHIRSLLGLAASELLQLVTDTRNKWLSQSDRGN